jgi:hypothetical protein
MARIVNKDQYSGNDTIKREYIENMETKLNELHKFRSYSYHHVLIVANTTEAADTAVSKSSASIGAGGDLGSLLHPSIDNKYEPIKTPGGGSYMVLVNGLTDAEFMIQSLEIEMLIDPNAKHSNAHAAFVEGTMEIVEPKGVRFLNLLKIACDNLVSDPIGLNFVLKTIFVGYTDGSNGSPRIQQIIDTAPFHFNVADLTAEFSATGAIYNLTFIGSVNGSSRMPMFAKVQQSNTSGGTVKSAIDQLVTRLNDATKKAKDTLTAQIDESNNTKKQAGVNYSPKGRLVQYVINVDPDFANMPLDNTNIRNKGAGGNAQLATPQGIDIESAISDIMYSTTGIADMLNKDIRSGYKNIFKIDSFIESTMELMTVTFTVKKCKVPVYVKDNIDKKGILLDPFVSNRPVIEFDYIFTGKNIEVLEYDMKMVMGLAFFMSISSTNNIPGKFNTSSGDITTLGSGSGTALNDRSTVMRDLTPIVSPATISDPNSRNKVETAKTADFRTFMARQAALESVASKLKINGIPWILGAFNMTFQEAGGLEISLKEQIPLIKMLVRMPAADADFKNRGADYTEEFWYDGYFQTTTIKHIFRDGRFTQEMDLIALPIEEMVAPSAAGAAPQKQPANNSTTPATNAAINTSKKASPKSTETAEQKAKLGEKSKAISPKDLLDCQSVRSARPITMESAKRTMLSKTITLYDLIRRPVNLPFLTDHILDNLCMLAKKLEEVQSFLGHNITITSGYRCEAYNNNTGGSSKTSDHMKAIAADFVCPGFGSTSKIFEALKNSGLDFRQVISERNRGRGSEWIHVSFNVDSTVPPLKPGTKKFFNLEV